jgi:hypothetical protein
MLSYIISIEEITRKEIGDHFARTCESPRSLCKRAGLQQSQFNKFLKHEGGLNTQTLQRLGKALFNTNYYHTSFESEMLKKAYAKIKK